MLQSLKNEQDPAKIISVPLFFKSSFSGMSIYSRLQDFHTIDQANIFIPKLLFVFGSIKILALFNKKLYKTEYDG